MRFLFMLAALGLGGCATTAPKEDLKDIFQAIKVGNGDDAFHKLQSSQSTKYDTYEGTTLYSDDTGGSVGKTVKWYVMFMNGMVVGCQSDLKEIKGINFENQSEEELEGLESKVSQLKEGFQGRCSFSNDSWQSETIEKIKAYSSVEFGDAVSATRLAFDKEIVRIENEIGAAKAKLGLQKQEAEQIETREKNSPKHIKKQICDHEAGIKGYQKIIANENEAAKQSGYVDKNKMYKAGKMIQQYKMVLEKLHGQYREKTGQAFNIAACKSESL